MKRAYENGEGAREGAFEVGSVQEGALPTFVIVGPTASGKTGVAIEIAREVDGEVICADSRTIYRGMDMGTAKPEAAERAGVPHWGLDLVEPGERFTVADWQLYALGKIAEIRARGKVPLVVGGTGLYVDALVYGYSFTERGKREQSDRQKMCSGYEVVGIKWEREELRKRIEQRVDKMFNDKLFEETRRLVAQYNWNTQAMKSDIYQFAWGYLTGKYSLERAKELCALDDWHLAKRQLTWFKRNPQIRWLRLAEVKPYVLKCIQNEQRK